MMQNRSADTRHLHKRLGLDILLLEQFAERADLAIVNLHVLADMGVDRWLRKFGQFVKVDLRPFQEDQIHGEAT